MNGNSIWLLWPEALEIAIALICLRVMMTTPLDPPPTSTRVRLLALLGFLVTGGLLGLGVRSALYAMLALPAIPAPFVFVVMIFRPRIFSDSPRLRTYLKLCVAVSGLAWAYQFLWLFRA